MSRLPPVLLAGAYAALMLAWVFGNPPGAAPDESSHYVRAVAMGEGQVRGAPVHDLEFPGLTPDQVRRLDIISRIFSLPERLAPRTFGCDAFEATASAGCLSAPSLPAYPGIAFHFATLPDRPVSSAAGRRDVVSYEATYPPFLYALPALPMNLAGDPSSALWIGRAVNALLCAALIAFAIRLLWRSDAGPCSLVGLAFATTPMVIFCSSYLSPSGPEIAGAICFWAGILRVVREMPGATPRAAWAGIAAGGVVLAAARPTGPLWIVAGAAFLAASLGIGPVLRMLRGHTRLSLLVLGPIGAAIGLNVAWELAFQSPLGVHPGTWPSLWGMAAERALSLSDQVVGTFGWLDTHQQPYTYSAWWAMLLAVVLLGALTGSRRQLWLLTASIALTMVLAIVLALPLGSLGGGDNVIQARHLLPFAVVVALLAGEMLVKARNAAGPVVGPRIARASAGLIVGAALLQAIAWHHNGRRYAGTNRVLFWLGSPDWSPPLGWTPWVLLVALGALAMVAAAVTSLAGIRQERLAASG